MLSQKQQDALEKARKDAQKVSGSWSEQVYMSNNINPFTVMPLAPNQVNAAGQQENIYVNNIYSYSQPIIQVLSDINIGNGFNLFIWTLWYTIWQIFYISNENNGF